MFFPWSQPESLPSPASAKSSGRRLQLVMELISAPATPSRAPSQPGQRITGHILAMEMAPWKIHGTLEGEITMNFN